MWIYISLGHVRHVPHYSRISLELLSILIPFLSFFSPNESFLRDSRTVQRDISPGNYTLKSVGLIFLTDSWTIFVLIFLLKSAATIQSVQTVKCPTKKEVILYKKKKKKKKISQTERIKFFSPKVSFHFIFEHIFENIVLCNINIYLFVWYLH